MSIDDELKRPAGGGKAIEDAWDKLRPDEPAEDEDGLGQLSGELGHRDHEDDMALDGEVMDDPVDTPRRDGHSPFERRFTDAGYDDQAPVPPVRDSH